MKEGTCARFRFGKRGARCKRCGVKLKLSEKEAKSFIQTTRELPTQNENQSVLNTHENNPSEI